MSTTARGEVFDIGFQRYTGPREGRRRARLAVYKDGVRAALGIGRGGRAKILPWLFIIAALIPALVLALIAGTVERLAPGVSGEIDLPTHADYYGIASIIMLIAAAVIGPELLCPDRRSGVINLYLVRPLTSVDYVAARWLALLTVMLLVAWLPQFILLAGLTLGAAEPGDYLADNRLDIPRFLGAGFAVALFTTTIALAVASFTTRRAYAAAFLVGLFVVSANLGTGLSETLDESTGRWLALINFGFTPIFLNDIIFDKASELTESSAVRALPNVVLVFWYILLTAGPGLILWLRYRRLSP